jgi:probable HAF family extracellular repeat protein
MHRIAIVLSIVGLCACGDDAELTPPRAAAMQQSLAARFDVDKIPGFDVGKLPSLGGAVSRGNSINHRDWIAGYSNLPGDGSRHAALWRGGSLLDLGTLGGPNSNVAWPGQNDRGTVVGIAETGDLDSLHESWSCSAFFPSVTGHTCRGFVWENGQMHALPTLGGTNGFATGVNDRGEVVGWAETKVHDPTCNAPQVLQFRAVMWDARTRHPYELRPLHGDSTSAATAINARGQAVGISGACDVAVGEFSAEHMVLWDRGHAREIPNLGGTSWNTPMAINEAGDVTGFSDLPGDAGGAFNAHAFLWTRERGTIDLGTLPGDGTSQAAGINSRRQVVGISCGNVACRAFLWENGVMYNLNKLAGAGFKDSLVSAQDINEDGTITGRLREAGTGKGLTFIAIPRHERR